MNKQWEIDQLGIILWQRQSKPKEGGGGIESKVTEEYTPLENRFTNHVAEFLF